MGDLYTKLIHLISKFYRTSWTKNSTIATLRQKWPASPATEEATNSLWMISLPCSVEHLHRQRKETATITTKHRNWRDLPSKRIKWIPQSQLGILYWFQRLAALSNLAWETANPNIFKRTRTNWNCISFTIKLVLEVSVEYGKYTTRKIWRIMQWKRYQREESSKRTISSLSSMNAKFFLTSATPSSSTWNVHFKTIVIYTLPWTTFEEVIFDITSAIKKDSPRNKSVSFKIILRVHIGLYPRRSRVRPFNEYHTQRS